MAEATLAGDLTYTSVIIPIICLPICIAYQAYEFGQKGGARAFFERVREGWIEENTLKGQQAVNTTRDYIRAAVFFANSAILITSFTASYAASLYSSCLSNGCSGDEWLAILKMGVLVLLLLVIFFVFTQSTRYAVHFSFCINTRGIRGKPLPKSLMLKVFNKSHRYYSLGIRLYFGTVPVFAWLFTEWALLVVTPLYLLVVHNLEDLDDMADEVKALACDALAQAEGGGEEEETGDHNSSSGGKEA